MLDRAHGWSSHPLSLHYGNTIDPVLGTGEGVRAVNICFLFVFFFIKVFPFVKNIQLVLVRNKTRQLTNQFQLFSYGAMS